MNTNFDLEKEILIGTRGLYFVLNELVNIYYKKIEKLNKEKETYIIKSILVETEELGRNEIRCDKAIFELLRLLDKTMPFVQKYWIQDSHYTLSFPLLAQKVSKVSDCFLDIIVECYNYAQNILPEWLSYCEKKVLPKIKSLEEDNQKGEAPFLLSMLKLHLVYIELYVCFITEYLKPHIKKTK